MVVKIFRDDRDIYPHEAPGYCIQVKSSIGAGVLVDP